MKKTRWTQSEMDFLKNNLKTMKIQDIANKLGRTEQSVSSKLKHLYKGELDRKSPKSADRHSLNVSKFQEDSDELFYLLGFIAADGNVCKTSNKITIRLSAKDSKLLENIKDWLEYTGSVRKEVQNGYKRGESAVLEISNKQLKNILLAHGIGPNKSKTIRLLNLVPNEYIGSFIRGVFDGDGSVCRSKDNAFVIYICSSSKGFLEDLQNLIKFGKISTNKRELHSLYIRSYERKKFFELIYEKKAICLQRKYDRMKDSYEYVRQDNWSHRSRNSSGQFTGRRA